MNNAGIAIDDGPPSRVSLDVLRRTYETNVFGVVRTIQAFLPLLRRSDAGRIVNLSSGLGSLAQNSDPDWEFAAVKFLAYNSSKTAVNAITRPVRRTSCATRRSRSTPPIPVMWRRT